MGLRNFEINEFGIPSYTFKINVEAGEMANIFSVDNNGQVRSQRVLLIPGIHEYTIIYAPCMYREDYKASRCANTMLVQATWPEYLGIHDEDKAFYDGCRRTLPIEFYNAGGKRIPDGEKKHTQGGTYK